MWRRRAPRWNFVGQVDLGGHYVSPRRSRDRGGGARRARRTGPGRRPDHHRSGDREYPCSPGRWLCRRHGVADGARLSTLRWSWRPRCTRTCGWPQPLRRTWRCCASEASTSSIPLRAPSAPETAASAVCQHRRRSRGRALAILGGSDEAAVGTSLAGQTLVVTAGGTREPIDPVRFLGNQVLGPSGPGHRRRLRHVREHACASSQPTSMTP